MANLKRGWKRSFCSVVKYISFILCISFLPNEAEAEISLLTVEPGRIIYELDGHTGLRFRSPQADIVVNWGVFDFAAPNFLYRFVKGETDYMAWPFPTELFITEYAKQGRGITEQILDLTPQEEERILQLVNENLLPQNRSYRYNYIYDNCATRPLALIEKAVGAPIQIPDVQGMAYGETGITDTHARHTFRGEMTLAHADYPWYQFGIDMALGSGLDKDITPRERTFSPLYLRQALRNATITDSATGKNRKLVRQTQVILPPAGRVTDLPTPWYLTPMFASALLLVITLWICARDLRRKRVTRWFDSVFFSLIFIMSLLLTFLIFVSVHEATSPNWLFLWINPLTLIPAAFIWVKSCKPMVYLYHFCNFVLLIALVVIGICHVQQLNSAFYLLIAADAALSARYILINRKNNK